MAFTLSGQRAARQASASASFRRTRRAAASSRVLGSRVRATAAPIEVDTETGAQLARKGIKVRSAVHFARLALCPSRRRLAAGGERGGFAGTEALRHFFVCFLRLLPRRMC